MRRLGVVNAITPLPRGPQKKPSIINQKGDIRVTPQIIWEYDLRLLDHRNVATNLLLILPEHLLHVHLMLCYHSSKINTEKAEKSQKSTKLKKSE